jgi:ABC-type glutathione transport system ATPase component
VPPADSEPRADSARPAGPPDVVLDLQHVSKEYVLRRTSWSRRPRLRAVRDVSLTLTRGETLGIVGESGCGKSTLGRIALTMLPPSSGRVLIDGADPARLRGQARRKLRRSIQAVFQDPAGALDPRLTIGQSIGEPLKAARTGSARQRKDAVDALLEMVGLDPARAGARPRELSGGQRQRVVIARALAPRPAVVVADEPVSALDVSVQAQVLNLFRDLQQSRQMSCLFISHDLAVVGFVADRIAVMYLGEIVELGPAAAVLATPRHPYTKTLKAAALAPVPSAHGAGPGPGPGPRPGPGSGPASAAAPAESVETEPATETAGLPVAATAGLMGQEEGCPFLARCPVARSVCASERPLLRQIEEGRWAACHLIP